jgi:hypothetical protein
MNALKPHADMWAAPVPQALGLRVDDRDHSIICRVSAKIRGEGMAAALYLVTLNAPDLRILSMRKRSADGRWIVLR